MQQLFRSVTLLLLLTISSAVGAQDLALPPTTATIGETVDTSTSLVVIADIQIIGYKRTKDYIIEREIPFKKGEYMLKSHLSKQVTLCRQQLMNTSLFVDVEVISKQIGDEVFIMIQVKERWYLFPLPYFKIVGRNLNDWLFKRNADLKRTNYGFKFEQYNVSGRNDKLKLYLITGYSQDAIIQYSNPYIDKTLRHGMGITLSYSRNKEVNYAIDSNEQRLVVNPGKFLINSYHFGLSYSYKPAIKTRHNLRFSLTDVSIDDTIVKLNPRFFPQNRSHMLIPEFTYGLEYYNVDYNPYPLKGFTGEAYFTMRMTTDYTTQLTLKSLVSAEIFPKSYLQFQGVGLIKLPFEQYYYGLGMMGGSDLYMRGLENYVIEGVAGGVVRATAIKQALAFTIKNPIRIKSHDKFPFRIMVKAFGDLGYAYKKPTDNFSYFNNKLLRTFGAGVDIISIYDLVFKVEYSFNQLGQSGIFLHTRSDF
jgi:outer membrane protein assembly factor BamA